MTTAVKTLFADASPAQIREAIVPEDRPEFDRQWREALNAAADALSLDEVHAMLESWRRVAWLVTAHGPEGYRRMMATAEQTLRARQSPPAQRPGSRSRPGSACRWPTNRWGADAAVRHCGHGDLPDPGA